MARTAHRDLERGIWNLTAKLVPPGTQQRLRSQSSRNPPESTWELKAPSEQAAGKDVVRLWDASGCPMAPSKAEEWGPNSLEQALRTIRRKNHTNCKCPSSQLGFSLASEQEGDGIRPGIRDRAPRMLRHPTEILLLRKELTYTNPNLREEEGLGVQAWEENRRSRVSGPCP